MKQKVFTKRFAEELVANLQGNIALYRNDVFEVSLENIVESNVDVINEHLAEDMEAHTSSVAREEFEAAKILFEAFPNLTPLQASHKPFWLYLAHVELYHYMRLRWPILANNDLSDEDLYKAVKQHFFNPSVIRNQLEGLYWLVRCSVIPKEDGTYDYTYTEFLFSRRKLGNRGIGASIYFRNPKVVRGMLRFYMDYENGFLTPHFEEKTDYCIQLINQKGAVSEISLWEEEDIYEFLLSHRSEIEPIIDRKEQKKRDLLAQGLSEADAEAAAQEAIEIEDEDTEI